MAPAHAADAVHVVVEVVSISASGVVYAAIEVVVVFVGR